MQQGDIPVKPSEPRDIYSLASSLQLKEETKLLPKLKPSKSLGQWQFWETSRRRKPLPPSAREIHMLSGAAQRMLQEYVNFYLNFLILQVLNFLVSVIRHDKRIC